MESRLKQRRNRIPGVIVAILLTSFCLNLEANSNQATSIASLLPPCQNPLHTVDDKQAFPCSAIIGSSVGLDADAIKQISINLGLQTRRVFKSVNAISGRVPNKQVLQNLVNTSHLTITPNRIITKYARPPGAGGGGGKGDGQVIPSGVKRIGADSADIPSRGEGIGIAIVDTGIDLSHPDLTVGQQCFSAYSDDCNDRDGHGTHVAGIAAAVDNNIGVVGVAPAATLYAVKVLDDRGFGADDSLIAGLEWILFKLTDAENPIYPSIQVVNMSLGRAGEIGDNSALRHAVTNLTDKGVTVVVAAGNDPYSEVKDNIPAAYPEVFAIASTTAEDGTSACRSHKAPILKDTASHFTTDGVADSKAGINGVTISAPGEARENINRGCFINSEGILSLTPGGGTTRLYGTSMATPHVAGAVALALSEYTPDQIRDRIRCTASGKGDTPYDSPTSFYSFDGDREGVLSVSGIFFGTCEQ